MELFPPMPLDEWRATKETLHRFEQVVGKVRLAASPRRNHWWNVPFHLTGRGITTRPMGPVPHSRDGEGDRPGDGGAVFTIDFDFVDHRLLVSELAGGTVSFPLQGCSVASFHRALVRALRHLGVAVDIERPRPFDLPDSSRPFAQDEEHATYDPAHANRWWRVLNQVALVLEEFAAHFSGKTSPVHHFWHTFDLAHSRFSGRRADPPPGADPVTREAYSREVISFGFWVGDDTFPEPAFYSYTAPEPAGAAEEPLAPAAARWAPLGEGHLAVLPYAQARRERDPRRAVLDFYESAYRAGARRAEWDTAHFASTGGVTDPELASHP